MNSGRIGGQRDVGQVGKVAALPSRVDAALDFAVRAHGNQKYGTEPYSAHLKEVMAGVTRLGFTDEKLLMTAALHDVIEDTIVGRAGIEKTFGKEVAQLVVELSHDHNVETKDYLRAMSDGAFAVKIADRLANVERMGTLENSPDRAAYLLAKYGPEHALFADEAKARGFDKAFAVLDAAMQKTTTAIRGAVDSYTLQQGRDRVEAKQKNLAGSADGKSGGGAFVAAMGGKKAAAPTSLSPMFAVRAPATPRVDVGQLTSRVDDLYKAADWKGLVQFLDDNRGAIDAAGKQLSATKDAPGLEKARVMHEKILVGLNKSKQFVRALEEAPRALALLAPEGVALEKLDKLSTSNRKELGEIYGAVGKAFREIANKAEKGDLDAREIAVIEAHVGGSLKDAPLGELRRHGQELSTKFYEASFFANRSYYGAVNAAHGNLRLGNTARAERFAWMAEASMKDGGHGAADYWLNATRLEVAILTNDDKKVGALFKTAAAQVTQPWEAETTARTLEDTARIFRRDTGAGRNDLKTLDAVCVKLRELEANPALATDATWLDAAAASLGAASATTPTTNKKPTSKEAPTLPAQHATLSKAIFEKTADTDWRHQSVDLDVLYQQAAVAKSKLDVVLDDVANAVGGVAVKAPLKGRPRAEQKIVDFAGDASQLVDIARGTLRFTSVDALYRGLAQLKDKVEIVGIKDRFASPYGSGYRDVLLKVRVPGSDGHVAELQLHLKSILEVKEGPGHDLYVEQRNLWSKGNLDDNDKAAIANLDVKMKALYDGAWLAGLKG